MEPLRHLEVAYHRYSRESGFRKELKHLLSFYAGRPTPLYFAGNLTRKLGRAKIYLKREDLLHGGAHKINNTLGQALLAKRMGKTRVIAETGAGQHGVATAMACAVLGLKAEVYMGSEDMERQRLNVYRMRILGAKIHEVESGSRTLKDSINEALRDWVSNIDDTYYLIGSVVGPHPYPTIVRDFQSVIGREARKQVLAAEGRLPRAIIACVGGGSNAMGIFHPFLNDLDVDLYGVEAAGQGVSTGHHAASLVDGREGVMTGIYTYVLQDNNGQIRRTDSISAGLDYPAVGPEHSQLMMVGRAKYSAVTDAEALAGFKLLSEAEGIIPALEPSHAISYATRLVKQYRSEDSVIINLSGRGDKDVETVAKALDY